mmetsp:Transcript_53445/g.120445  ORF Transcript_53445/g.120445 Transcript_53445/m.120445 type:complete len:507 (-) Transcript_53445:122-1642(-)
MDFDDLEDAEETQKEEDKQAWNDVPRGLRPGLAAAAPFKECKYVPPFVRMMVLKKFVEKASQRLPGDLYGLPLPATPEELHSDAFGAKWLTEAFHKAGSLPEDNSVKRIVSMRRFEGGGSGPKGLFIVEYEKPDEELDTRLFIKMPHPLSENQQQRFVEEGQGKFGDNWGGETSFYRFLSPHVPFPVPKLYFADLSRESTEACIINYAVEWPSEGKTDFQPYELLPPCGKCEDYVLQDPNLYYFAVLRRLGTFAGLAKSNQLGPDLQSMEWYDVNPTRDIFVLPGFPGTEKSTRTFIEEIAPHIWPPSVNKKAFLDKFVKKMALVNELSKPIAEYLYSDPAYIGLHHQNGNTDNAYFYRDEAGELCAGILDWGSTAHMSYGSGFQGTFVSALGDMLAEYDDRLVQAWLDAYHRAGGPTMEYEELLLRYRLAACTSAYGCCSSAIQWAKPEAKEFWSTMKAFNDDKIRADFGLKFSMSMLYNRVLLFALRGDVYWASLAELTRRKPK